MNLSLFSVWYIFTLTFENFGLPAGDSWFSSLSSEFLQILWLMRSLCLSCRRFCSSFFLLLSERPSTSSEDLNNSFSWPPNSVTDSVLFACPVVDWESFSVVLLVSEVNWSSSSKSLTSKKGGENIVYLRLKPYFKKGWISDLKSSRKNIHFSCATGTCFKVTFDE